MISLIVAASTNNVIGAHGDLPWKLGDDLRRFKRLTMGKPIVMGRKTWQSIGRPLPGRQNIVMTRQADFAADGCDVVTSTAAALSVAGDAAETMVIGGGQIYAEFLPEATRLYVTRVRAVVDGDAFFPEIDPRVWQVIERESHDADDAHTYAFDFIDYQRIELP